MRKLLAILVLLASLAACGGDDDDGSTSSGADDGGSECPDISGATLQDLEEVFGRPPDHVEDYGGHFWYFGDDDQVVVTFPEGGGPNAEADGWAWHDGDEFMAEEDKPNCPLPQPDEGHPARFNIEDNEPSITDPEGNVERYAEYTRCIREDEVPNDQCPTPGEQLEDEQGMSNEDLAQWLYQLASWQHQIAVVQINACAGIA